MARVGNNWRRRIPGLRIPGALGAAVLLGAVLLSPGRAAEGTPEYDLKAVFLYRFTSFVDWPDSVFRTADEPLVIGILGRDPFGDALEEIIRSEKVRNRPIRVRHFADVQDVRDCQILFISRSERGRLGRILGTLRGRPILLVSEIDGFPAEGGMVGFSMAESRVQLTINVASVRSAGLTVSSKLLRVARVIGG